MYANAIVDGFGWKLEGKWNLKELKKIYSAGYDVGMAFVREKGGSVSSALKSVYQNGLVFIKSTQICSERFKPVGAQPMAIR